MSSTDRVEKLLRAGKRLTVAQLDRMLSTNNSPETIRRVKKRIPVNIEWKVNKNTGKRYGVYYAG